MSHDRAYTWYHERAVELGALEKQAKHWANQAASKEGKVEPERFAKLITERLDDIKRREKEFYEQKERDVVSAKKHVAKTGIYPDVFTLNQRDSYKLYYSNALAIGCWIEEAKHYANQAKTYMPRMPMPRFIEQIKRYQSGLTLEQERELDKVGKKKYHQRFEDLPAIKERQREQELELLRKFGLEPDDTSLDDSPTLDFGEYDLTESNYTSITEDSASFDMPHEVCQPETTEIAEALNRGKNIFKKGDSK